MPRSNRERTDATRTALLDAARSLFVEKGYAETATPEIVAKAEVTRGALYHHFPDKKALFWAVIEREAGQVAEDIEACSAEASSAREALLQGASAYFDAMAVPGRVRLLLREAPAQFAIDSGQGEDPAESGLKIGLSHLMANSPKLALLDPLTVLISSAFEKAAMAIDCGESRTDYEAAIAALLDGLAD
ncbi:TetR/AcrR family transcriptional regulator [Rhizobium sp. XQZ8]|uniref:TetR/AcrR family transcriptional regulator n=1 Tax=Rhizobium populisoli TaxID=2859785 RepID=UPI001C67DC31|nr:TetR/AcrR family transcriptional regulator [Rhizobium populisoli]MBW6421816.1 TetR/AcrR family transcriptional regulator [Rhizobium populisoli]